MKEKYLEALLSQASNRLLDEMIEDGQLSDDEFDLVSKQLTSRELDEYERIHNL